MQGTKIKVLIVDDSIVSRELMIHVLSIDPNIDVIGTANDGVEALEFISKNPPDLVFTDIVMPRMNGFELTQKIMETHPIPVVVVSGVYNREEIAKGFKAIDAGAISILEKPKGIEDSKFYETTKFILDALSMMSQVRSLKQKKNQGNITNNEIQKYVNERKSNSTSVQALAIGSSLVGPKALQTLLSGLTPTVKIPIFIVQHIVPGFVQGFVDWLGDSIKLKVQLAKQGEKALPGHVYVAPDKVHMEILPGNIISLIEDNSQSRYVPSIGKLFRSVGNIYGKSALGILLLGAEKDGAKDLHYMNEQGAFTIVEEGLNLSKYTGQPSEKVLEANFEEMSSALTRLLPT